MTIKQVNIKNFRCFKQLEVTFHPQLTVLVAQNGAGKTTILDAVRIALWPFVKGFDLGSQAGKSATIQIDDVRLEQRKQEMEPIIPSTVTAHGQLTAASTPSFWAISRLDVKKRTQTRGDKATQALTRQAETIQQKVRDDKTAVVDLPLILYLGTGRLWYQGRYSSEVDDGALSDEAFSRFWGYQNCLTATSSYKQFESWFGTLFRSYRELQIAQLEGGHFDPLAYEDYAAAINVIQKSINHLTLAATGWHDLQYRASKGQQLVMFHEQHGYIPLSMLSDGLRNMVAMISDIAFRCIKLNAHFGREAAVKTRGVVLIDEVDMFLHPKWQQQVISALRNAFPLVQFVVTTHSPQVLSTVPSECVRILNNGNVYSAPEGTQGAESSRMLKRIFGVESRPSDDPVTQKLNKYLEQVYQDNWDQPDMLQLRKDLNQHFGHEEPALAEADLYIEGREWERQIEKDC